ncbi:MAG TPA: DinB family protein [Thermomicrobiaceae bacterium]|nr:DinB family protein [Thermomicrobiaceae bacterium]
MPTRAEILAGLETSQTEVIAFFEGLSPYDLERPATASDVPGAALWSAKDHFAHLVQNEYNIQQLLHGALEGKPRDEFLLSQYPAGMPLPSVLGDWEALTAEEQERLELAVAGLNQAYLTAHQDDTLEQLVAEYRAARLELLDLLQQFSDEQLSAPVPTVVGEAAAGDIFAGRAAHATEHITWIEEGWRRNG